MVARFLPVIVAIILLFQVKTANAYHTDEDRQTDFSAFTLQQTQFRLGLFQLEYGIFDSWTVGTYTLPWVAIPIVRSPVLNLYTKWKFLHFDGFASSVRVTAFYVDVEDFSMGNIENGAFKSLVVPTSLTLSYVFDGRWTASLDSTFVLTGISAGADATGDVTAFGAVAQSNFQFALTGEFRINDVIALNLVTRWVPYVTEARIRFDNTVDDSVVVSIDAAIEPGDLRNAWLIQPGVTFSWKHFNLQIGVGYGKLFGLEVA